MQFDDGHGVVVAVLPGFIGTIVVDCGRVLGLSYLPCLEAGKPNDYEIPGNNIKERQAYAAVAMRLGQLRIDRNKDKDFPMVGPSVDPTLGLYAAYAFAQAGDIGGVEWLYEQLCLESGPVFYDLALLAGKLASHDGHPVAPFCPMLTQGWAIAQANGCLPCAIREAGQYMVPGHWATFEKEGMDLLWSVAGKNDGAPYGMMMG